MTVTLQKYQVAALSLILIGLTALMTFHYLPVQAAYNTATARYEDTITNPHQEAVYTFQYENTAPDTAPGYFAFNLEGFGASLPSDLIEITSVTDTYPVDSTTFQAITGTQVKTVNPAQAVYVEGGQLKIQYSPQNTCTPKTSGGCEWDLNGNGQADNSDTLVPAAVAGKITIKASLKVTAPTGTNTVQGGGSLKFPNGYDSGAVNWRIVANHIPTNDVYDAVSGTATVKGPSGTGSPALGQSYTVVTENLKATTGSPLQAPTGTCKTTVGGTVYTGTGISNGVCTVTITTPATAAIPSGTVDVNDGGTPRAIIRNGIPYTGLSFFIIDPACAVGNTSCFDPSEITVVCQDAAVNSSTTCSFTIPAGSILPADSKLGVGDSIPAGSCTISGQTATCTGIPTGSQPGQQPIFIQQNAQPKVDTGEKANVLPGNVTDIAALSIYCESAPANVTTSCRFLLPGTSILPVGFKLGIGDAAPAGTCTATGSIVNCTGIPTGSQTQNQIIFGQIGATAKVDSGEKVFIYPVSDLGSAEFAYNPTEGSNSPLFRSQDTVSVNVKNLKTILDPVPADNQFNCKIEIRAMQGNVATGPWTVLGDNLPYSATNGCAATFTKAQRSNGLNWSLKSTIRKNDDSTRIYITHSNYIYRFQGAGIASGG